MKKWLTKPAKNLKIPGRKIVRLIPLSSVSTMASTTVSTCKRGIRNRDWFVSPLKRGVFVKLSTASDVRTLSAFCTRSSWDRHCTMSTLKEWIWMGYLAIPRWTQSVRLSKLHNPRFLVVGYMHSSKQHWRCGHDFAGSCSEETLSRVEKVPAGSSSGLWCCRCRFLRLLSGHEIDRRCWLPLLAKTYGGSFCFTHRVQLDGQFRTWSCRI